MKWTLLQFPLPLFPSSCRLLEDLQFLHVAVLSVPGLCELCKVAIIKTISLALRRNHPQHGTLQSGKVLIADYMHCFGGYTNYNCLINQKFEIAMIKDRLK